MAIPVTSNLPVTTLSTFKWEIETAFLNKNWLELCIEYGNTSPAGAPYEDTFMLYGSLFNTIRAVWFDVAIRTPPNPLVVEYFTLPYPRFYFYRIPLYSSGSKVKITIEAVVKPNVILNNVRSLHIEAKLV